MKNLLMRSISTLLLSLLLVPMLPIQQAQAESELDRALADTLALTEMIQALNMLMGQVTQQATQEEQWGQEAKQRQEAAKQLI